MKVKDIYGLLDSVAPFATAAEWDNCGLAVGSFQKDVTKVLIALDVTGDVIDEAVRMGAELVITHHPLIFNPVGSIQSDSLLYKAVGSGITFISSHTCLDISPVGVNMCLAEKVGIKNPCNTEVDSFLFVGDIEPCTAEEFALKIKSALGGTVSYTLPQKIIKKVAFCSGAGGDLVFSASAVGADALLTGEAKHHEYLYSRENDVALLVAGHYETENIICERLCELLKEQFNGSIEVAVSALSAPVEHI